MNPNSQIFFYSLACHSLLEEVEYQQYSYSGDITTQEELLQNTVNLYI